MSKIVLESKGLVSYEFRIKERICKLKLTFLAGKRFSGRFGVSCEIDFMDEVLVVITELAAADDDDFLMALCGLIGGLSFFCCLNASFTIIQEKEN